MGLIHGKNRSVAKLEDLKKRKAQLEARIVNQENREKTQARKKRTRDLIEIGGLAEIAGLRELDRGALLGALLFVAKIADKEPARVRRWKTNGDDVLASRKKQRQTKRQRKVSDER